ncbi:MAG: hypothetical protein CBB68_04215 [Rhodospirillaceae bacterium TMED8]|nr:hypothetical protein [Magnetovibrio sp.]OUT51542.1 MAG: hypothetical protein CBB68_04215 [Rhodospirillaceae bacterium TMED8]|tara:strand:+ start:3597 stop:3962 length:366 start_codon:yes stop_codon:yes gene_type:complete
MEKKIDRVILEMGSGASLRSGDYNKAACRAVEDAIHNSSLSFLKELNFNVESDMAVHVTIGVQDTNAINAEKVKAILPHGIISIFVVKGGLNVPYPSQGYTTIIASAAIEVFVDMSGMSKV